MRAMGRILNFKLAKRYLLLSVFLTICVSGLLLFYSVTLFEEFTDFHNFDILMLAIVISILIGAHLIISVIYLFLLLNTKARFWQLNQLIR